jgi:hypothetical protein
MIANTGDIIQAWEGGSDNLPFSDSQGLGEGLYEIGFIDF